MQNHWYEIVIIGNDGIEYKAGKVPINSKEGWFPVNAFMRPITSVLGSLSPAGKLAKGTEGGA